MLPPALLDPGPPNAEVSTSLSFDIFVSQPKHSEEGLSHSHSSRTMYPSSLGGNLSRFSNSSEENPSLSFDSPALPRSSSGLSKPRLNKVRKQLSSQNLTFAGVSERGLGQGFNPFRPEPYRFESEPGSGSGSNAFVFRTSRDDLGSSVAEEMMNLKIGSGNEFVNKTNDGFVFGSKGRSVGVDEMKLEEDMRKLKIGGVGYGKSGESGRAEFVFRSGDNVGGLDGKGVESGLENEFKMKLSVKDGGKDDGSGVVFGANDGRKFVFDGSKKSGESPAATELHDQMKNLNLTSKNEVVFDVDEEEKLVFGSSHRSGDSLGANELRDQMKNLNSINRNEMDDTKKEKDGFGFGKDKGSGMNLVGERENVLSNEMGRKLNIGSITSDSTGEAGVGRFSSQNFAKDNQTGNVDDKRLDNVDESVPMGFTSKAAMQSRDESGSQIFVEQRNDGARPSEMDSSSSSFSSSGAHFQSVDNSSTVLGMDRPDKRHEFRFASSQDVVGTPFVEFKTPNSKANLFSGVSQNLEFTAKRDFVGDSKLKKRRGKLRQANPVQLRHGQDFVSTGSVSQENPEPSESYSPMDVSPYHETLVGTLCSRETSVASDESLILDSNEASNDSQTMVSNVAVDQDLVAATQHMDINDEYAGSRETEEGHSKSGIAVVRPPEESISGAETESFKSANEEIDLNFDSSVNSVETEAGSSSNVNRQDIDCRKKFSFPSHSEEKSGSNFTFAAASTASAGSAGQSHLSASKRQHKKKNSVKIGHDSFTSTSKLKVPRAPASLQFSAFSGPSQLLSAQQSEKGEQFSPRLKVGHKTEVDRGQEIKQEPDLTSAASIAAQEACEKWRLRGNQAYTNGQLSKAEDCYTQGINCVSKGETSRSCLRALMLCYSNRAATRMSLGRMRDALADCMSAVAIDPNFLRVQVRAGNCYLALGEIEDASLCFRKCLQSGSDICVDRKIAVDASDGLQKAQKVSECMQRAVELLQNKMSNNADNAEIALGVIDEALNISSYSESLLEMKAEALFMLQKYEEVIQLCEQTIDSAEKNSSSLDVVGQLANLDGHEPSRDFTFRLWRCHLIFKSHFYLGRLEEAIASLEKLELRSGGKTLESSIPLAATVRKLLRHKAAGNEAFQAGRHSEAVEHYTVALSCTVESRSFAAICFCNRAAAYKALGHVTEAIADCSVAIALDGNYLKAISRRATLYEMIRDYGDAASDLQRLIALLTKLVEKTNQSGASDRSTNWVNDLRQARLRLSAIEEAARKDIPLDMYLILGVERSALTADIKKAYRKAALRYHPDKAGQSLVRSDYGDDRLWKGIGAEVHKDADRLFKMIGEAYAVLSNPDKRLRYDLEEDNRNAQKKRNGSNAPGAQHDAQNCPFDRSSSRRQWREVWRSYGDSPTKWSEHTRPTRFS